MIIRWVFKNGYSFDTECAEFNYGFNNERNNGMIAAYEMKEVTKNLPVGINFDELIAVYNLLADNSNDLIDAQCIADKSALNEDKTKLK